MSAASSPSFSKSLLPPPRPSSGITTGFPPLETDAVGAAAAAALVGADAAAEAAPAVVGTNVVSLGVPAEEDAAAPSSLPGADELGCKSLSCSIFMAASRTRRALNRFSAAGNSSFKRVSTRTAKASVLIGNGVLFEGTCRLPLLLLAPAACALVAEASASTCRRAAAAVARGPAPAQSDATTASTSLRSHLTAVCRILSVALHPAAASVINISMPSGVAQAGSVHLTSLTESRAVGSGKDADSGARAAAAHWHSHEEMALELSLVMHVLLTFICKAY